jgi:hypothetical protein
MMRVPEGIDAGQAYSPGSNVSVMLPAETSIGVRLPVGSVAGIGVGVGVGAGVVTGAGVGVALGSGAAAWTVEGPPPHPDKKLNASRMASVMLFIVAECNRELLKRRVKLRPFPDSKRAAQIRGIRPHF